LTGLRRPAVADAFEQEDGADRVSARKELIAARVGELGNKALGTEF
jgi:hypothetical protein